MTNYYLTQHSESGEETLRVRFDGSEYVKTKCGKCGAEVGIGLFTFCDIVANTDFDFYGTALYCPACTIK